MGYTHYRTSRGFTRKEWPQLTFATTEIIPGAKHSGVEAAGSASDGPAQITDLEIAFNCQNATACEPSMLSRTAGRGFCETQRLPYDAVVVAVLLAAEGTGALTWKSDGRHEDYAVGLWVSEGKQ